MRLTRLVVLTAITLVCFASNSLLTRAGLDRGSIDPSSFLMLRLLTGALVLAPLAGLRASLRAGSWWSAVTLAIYGVTFTLAYLRLGAAVGALLLFGTVQVTMIGWGMVRRERPTRRGLAGLALAFTGLIVLTAPGVTAPDSAGALLMIAAGVMWGVYSLHGRTAGSPLAANAGNFLLTVPLAGVSLLVLAFTADASLVPPIVIRGEGLLLAMVSGAVGTGLGYAAWYAVLPALTAWRAAIVQLLVPVIAAAGGVTLLGESLTWRPLLAGAAVLGGVALAVMAPRRATMRRRG